MATFAYEALPMRVRFGAGSISAVEREAADLGLERLLVLSTPGQQDLAERIAQALGSRCAGVFSEARMHVPAELAGRARARADEIGADGYVAVGGGSAIGLGKAIAMTSGHPVLAVPTTYAGSEMTSVWGLTEGGVKQTGRDPRVLPAAVVYDPELTLSLPAELSVTSGFNAIAHAVEALYAPDRSPIVALMAEEGVRALAAALPAVVADPVDLDARTLAQYGAWLCGACLGATTMSLHHKLCHALGGTLGLPHAPTHTVVLPNVLAFNAGSAPAAVAALGRALGTDDPVGALWQLEGDLGAPRSLADLGMAEADVARIADQAMAEPYANPREVHRNAVVELLHDAWRGDAPRRRPV